MNSTFEIEIDLLVAPCDGDSVVGVDLRLTTDPDNPYRLMKEARYTARKTERKYFDRQDVDQSTVYWQTVAEHGIAILQSRSKDIDVLAWLTEAWLRLHGFAGLSRGFELTLKCFEQYGLALYPQPPAEESREWQVKALTAWNGEAVEGSLLMPMRLISITQASSYALWQYQQALEIDRLTDTAQRDKHMQQGAVLLDDFIRELYATPRDVLLAMQKHMEQAQHYFCKLTELLQELFKEVAPPSDRITHTLKEYQQHLSHLIALHQKNSAVQDEKDALRIVDDVSKKQQKESTDSQQDYTRASALSEIEHIAQFIQTTEPQSPIPFMLQRVVHWAQLPLPELLAKIIQDKTALERVSDLIGIDTQSHSQ